MLRTLCPPRGLALLCVLGALAGGPAGCRSAAPPMPPRLAPIPPPAPPPDASADTDADDAAADAGAAPSPPPSAAALLAATVPPPLQVGSAEQLAFDAAARRQVAPVYLEDADDPSVLLALQQQLGELRPLRRSQAAWGPALAAALGRVHALRQHAAARRALGAAFGHAHYDEGRQAFVGVDLRACRAALLALPEAAATTALQLTVPPVGWASLHELRGLCEAARTTAAARALPGTPAPPALGHLVRRLMGRQAASGEVRRVTLVAPWRRVAAAGRPPRRRLQAAVGLVGVEDESVDGVSCAVREITLVAPLHGGTPHLADSGELQPIDCARLQ